MKMIYLTAGNPDRFLKTEENISNNKFQVPSIVFVKIIITEGAFNVSFN